MFEDLAMNGSLSLDGRGGATWQHAVWGLPQDSSVHWLLRLSGPGYWPVRWYSRIEPGAPGISQPGHWIARLTRWTTSAVGRPFPRAEYVPLENPWPIVQWMSQELHAGRTPHLASIISAVVHLCQVARQAGVDLHGAHFSVSGEPVTEHRVQVVRERGASVLPTYGTKEAGVIAHGCLQPSVSDDMHFYANAHALIQPGSSAVGMDLPPDALLISSLRLAWPYVLLYVSLGDRADLNQRSCGCPLERLGWTTHLQTVRSFEKLKVGATNVLTNEIIRLIDQDLPTRFGGGPTDYQLIEDEAAVNGQTRLRLLIHPSVGKIDDDAVLGTLLTAFREAGAPIDQLWREQSWVQVERRPPLVTAGGKIYHLHRAGWPTAP
jgi:hypothetical protein